MKDEDRPMPPMIAFAGALGGLAVVRWAYRTALRVNRELEEARLARVAEAARSNEIPTLRRAPHPGAYRRGCFSLRRRRSPIQHSLRIAPPPPTPPRRKRGEG